MWASMAGSRSGAVGVARPSAPGMVVLRPLSAGVGGAEWVGVARLRLERGCGDDAGVGSDNVKRFPHRSCASGIHMGGELVWTGASARRGDPVWSPGGRPPRLGSQKPPSTHVGQSRGGVRPRRRRPEVYYGSRAGRPRCQGPYGSAPFGKAGRSRTKGCPGKRRSARTSSVIGSRRRRSTGICSPGPSYGSAIMA